MDARVYLSYFYGNKEKAIEQLEKSIALYENSPNKKTPKIEQRISDYKELLNNIQILKQ